MKRKCDNCNKEYEADERNIKRGWGLCCSKSCAASKREKSKPNYNSIRVDKNNIRRVLWNDRPICSDENYYGTYRGKRTSEGYKKYEDGKGNFTAVDEFDDPVYTDWEGNDDDGDSEYWDNSDNGHDY
jgi:hypothetical protein